VAQPTDDPKVRILPDSELNPLLNPLLVTHMGRWAEVYFTSPPEKRAEAVSDLVRELANNSVPAETSTRNNEEEGRHGTLKHQHEQDVERQREWNVENQREPEQSAGAPPPIESAPVCGTCGHRNSAVQRFCGMCGSPLATSAEPSPQQLAEAAQLSAAGWVPHEAALPGEVTSSGEPVSARESFSREESFARDESISREEIELDLRSRVPFSARQESPAEFGMLSHYQPEPAPHSYKIYVGAIVAILLAVLVYMTWRSNSAFWSSSTVPAALPQAVPTPSGEAQAGPPARPSEAASAEPNSDNAVTTTRASAAAPRQNPRSQNHRKTATRAEENSQRMTTRPAAQIVPVAASAATGAGQNGSEELAMAERYLRAGPGRSRDSQEAVIWLWKAVAKQNLTATTLLSDLYLRGDGVTKNCDQARLLLEAAARKGGTAAAERLRNLQAFGCQ
jgi:hypothetical protein